MSGTTGRAAGGNYIAALDAETGKQAWRFYTIARPDEAGGNSWNGLPLEKRNGASASRGAFPQDLIFLERGSQNSRTAAVSSSACPWYTSMR